MLQNPELHYLDNAATTIVAPEVADVIDKAMREHWANPSSLYAPGARSEEALNAARAAVARTLGCKSKELYFTSCGSEGNNLALLGAAQTRTFGKGIVVCGFEHPSVQRPLERLAKQGYDMIGVDLSDSMLDIAMEKRAQSGHNILYLQQDMREFELYGTVRAVICLCDSLNYLLEEDDLLTTFKLVNNYLDPNGLFIFDFNTVYKYETVIGDSTIAENREDCSFIWENYYTAEDQINEYDLTIFVKQQKDLFRKFTETHLQRGYTLETMKRLVEQSGLIFVEALDADTHGSVTETSERIYVIAREHGKNLG